MNAKRAALLIQSQVVIAAAMTGIIWFVQRVTYPQFLDAEAAGFPEFHDRYTTALAPIVAPLMIAELGLALLSLRFFRRSPQRKLVLVGAILAGALWLTTFLVQVPLHDQLSQGWREPEIRKLIDTNWIRAILWSARLGLLLLLASRLPFPAIAHRNP